MLLKPQLLLSQLGSSQSLAVHQTVQPLSFKLCGLMAVQVATVEVMSESSSILSSSLRVHELTHHPSPITTLTHELMLRYAKLIHLTSL